MGDHSRERDRYLSQVAVEAGAALEKQVEFPFEMIIILVRMSARAIVTLSSEGKTDESLEVFIDSLREDVRVIRDALMKVQQLLD